MKSKLLVSFFVLLISVSTVQATLIDLAGASLNGAQQVPPVDTDAFGLAIVRYDDVNQEIQVRLIVEGIELGDLAANPGRFHIHGPAAVGETAGVILDLGSTQAFKQFGQLISFEQSGIPLPNPEVNLPLIRSNRTYLNLHTSAHPSGEIRGQIIVIPEPGTFMLACLSLLSLYFYGRRRFAA